MIYKAARLIRHGQRYVLRFGRGDPGYTALARCYVRVSCLKIVFQLARARTARHRSAVISPDTRRTRSVGIGIGIAALSVLGNIHWLG